MGAQASRLRKVTKALKVSNLDECSVDEYETWDATRNFTRTGRPRSQDSTCSVKRLEALIRLLIRFLCPYKDH